MAKKVLIIDDEQDVTVYLKAVLEANGYDCRVARNADSALKLAKEYQPDLISLDIIMPEESGISLYLRFDQDEVLAIIPVFIISGMTTEEEFSFHKLIPDPNVSGPKRFFEKPIDVRNFIEAVEEEIGPAHSNAGDSTGVR